MRVVAFAYVVTLVNAASNIVEAAEDASVMSLLQHSARPIHKIAEITQAGTPPADAVERIRARREAKRANPDRTLTAQQEERRTARRSAKRQAQAADKAAGQRHFADNGKCDICLAKCEELFEDLFKQCMIDKECQAWQKEDGPSSDKCKRRCDRLGNWQRTPCNQNCICDADEISLFETKKVQPQWIGGHHRCRDAGVGQVSNCQLIAQDRDSIKFNSLHKCARAAAEANADTFNFYRTAKEFAKCDLKNCGSANLNLINATSEPEVPAGHGGWKVFSTYCTALPVGERNLDGETIDDLE